MFGLEADQLPYWQANADLDSGAQDWVGPEMADEMSVLEASEHMARMLRENIMQELGLRQIIVSCVALPI